MGKSKPKERKGHSNHQDDPKNRKRGIIKRDYSQSKSGPQHHHHQPSQKAVKVPFLKQDHVLLVGEGDFSFTRSLKQHHGLKRVVATCFDGEKELHGKYPHVKGNLLAITGVQALSGADADFSGARSEDEDDEEWNGFSSSSSDSSSDESFDDGDFIFREDLLHDAQPTAAAAQKQTSIHYGINATKLSTTHRKLLSAEGPFSKIVFNFPHVGGLSTDVNRQVRANQELLVGFFNAAKGLLASEQNPVSRQADDDEPDEEDVDFDLETGEPLHDATSTTIPTKGQIIVTLFEGEPYTLWNIRDLARHCGLKVVESFRFPWSAYPGYKHARTIGEIAGKMQAVSSGGGSGEGKRAGAWRGEEREARMFLLEVKDEESAVESQKLAVQAEGTGGNSTVMGKRRKKKKGEINGEESDVSD
jgi:25S rRNA (uracil2634-N3)-methyltransferase